MPEPPVERPIPPPQPRASQRRWLDKKPARKQGRASGASATSSLTRKISAARRRRPGARRAKPIRRFRLRRLNSTGSNRGWNSPHRRRHRRRRGRACPSAGRRCVRDRGAVARFSRLRSAVLQFATGRRRRSATCARSKSPMMPDSLRQVVERARRDHTAMTRRAATAAAPDGRRGQDRHRRNRYPADCGHDLLAAQQSRCRWCAIPSRHSRADDANAAARHRAAARENSGSHRPGRYQRE